MWANYRALGYRRMIYTNGAYRSMQLNHLRAYPAGAAARTGQLSGGVPLGAKVWRELSTAAEALGVAVPTPLDG